jgi:hypothetical protein
MYLDANHNIISRFTVIIVNDDHTILTKLFGVANRSADIAPPLPFIVIGEKCHFLKRSGSFLRACERLSEPEGDVRADMILYDKQIIKVVIRCVSTVKE